MPQTTHKNARISSKARRAENRTGDSTGRESAHSKGGRLGGHAGRHAPAIRDRIKSLRRVRAEAWRDVQRRLLQLYKRGDAYSSIGDLAKRLGCAKATIQKAIKNSTKLKGWQARHTKAKGSPRASSLTEIVMDTAEQTREQNPAEAATLDDPEEVLAHLIQDAEPKVRAKLNAIPPKDVQDMTGDQVRQMVDMIADDPDNYNRIIGRTP